MNTGGTSWHQEFPEFGELFRWRAVDDTIVVDDPVALGGDAATTAWAVALLRECASWGLLVHWEGTAQPAFDATELHHLPPPRSLDGRSPALARWRENHRYGSLHFRLGPGFIHVKDVRNPVRGMRYQLSDAGTIGVFTRCLRPARLTDLSEPERAEAESLAADRLLLRVGDLLVTLPSRMRRWPVPVDAV